MVRFCQLSRGNASEVPAPGHGPDQKILTALCIVIQTPHASGTPTKAQNSAAWRSSPPLPMPKEPDGAAAAAVRARRLQFGDRFGFICHLASTGLTMELQIRPSDQHAGTGYTW